MEARESPFMHRSCLDARKRQHCSLEPPLYVKAPANTRDGVGLVHSFVEAGARKPLYPDQKRRSRKPLATCTQKNPSAMLEEEMAPTPHTLGLSGSCRTYVHTPGRTLIFFYYALCTPKEEVQHGMQ